MCGVLSCDRPAERGRYTDTFCFDCRLRLLEEIDGTNFKQHIPEAQEITWDSEPDIRRWKRDKWDRYYEKVGA